MDIVFSGLSVSVDADDMHVTAEVADAAVGDSSDISSAVYTITTDRLCCGDHGRMDARLDRTHGSLRRIAFKFDFWSHSFILDLVYS